VLFLLSLLFFIECLVRAVCISAAGSRQNAKKGQDCEIATTQDKPTSSAADAPTSFVPQPVSAAANEDEVDIDLADPEVQKAAAFIQSGFKGFKQRKISQGFTKVGFLVVQASVC